MKQKAKENKKQKRKTKQLLAPKQKIDWHIIEMQFNHCFGAFLNCKKFYFLDFNACIHHCLMEISMGEGS